MLFKHILSLPTVLFRIALSLAAIKPSACTAKRAVGQNHYTSGESFTSHTARGCAYYRSVVSELNRKSSRYWRCATALLLAGYVTNDLQVGEPSLSPQG
jgi:hypothetical protein